MKPVTKIILVSMVRLAGSLSPITSSSTFGVRLSNPRVFLFSTFEIGLLQTALLVILERRSFKLCLTGSDNSHQLGPIERTHHTVANSIRAQLIGANIDIRFWPYCFDHTIRLLSANSCAGMDSYRLQVVYGCREIFWL